VKAPPFREERFGTADVEVVGDKGLRLRSESRWARGSRGVRITVVDHPHGIPVSYTVPRRGARDIDPVATVVSAALRGSSTVVEEDLRVRVRRARAKRLCAILLDSSGSMAAARRIEVAKGVAANFVKNAYVKRDELALICFRGARSEVLSPPTRRYSEVLRLLDGVKTGGRTPLPSALYDLAVMAKAFKAKHRNAVVIGVLVTDGKANVPLGRDVKEDLERLCGVLRRMGVRLEIYDTRIPCAMDPTPSFIDLIVELTGAEVHRDLGAPPGGSP
jgi:magnesium chelatase subunit D